MSIRIVVTGGRYYDNRALVYATLDERTIAELAHGACPYPRQSSWP